MKILSAILLAAALVGCRPPAASQKLAADESFDVTAFFKEELDLVRSFVKVSLEAPGVGLPRKSSDAEFLKTLAKFRQLCVLDIHEEIRHDIHSENYIAAKLYVGVQDKDAVEGDTDYYKGFPIDHLPVPRDFNATFDRIPDMEKALGRESYYPKVLAFQRLINAFIIQVGACWPEN